MRRLLIGGLLAATLPGAVSCARPADTAQPARLCGAGRSLRDVLNPTSAPTTMPR
ncbi:hypothetical protein ACPA9J_08230 [Pseudomonas aeruginosa]